MPTIELPIVAQNVRRVRHARELTQRELAAKAKLTQRTIALIERGLRPSDGDLRQIANVLDVTVEDLTVQPDLPEYRRA